MRTNLLLCALLFLAACGEPVPTPEPGAEPDAGCGGIAVAEHVQCAAPIYPDGAAGPAVRVRHDVYRRADGRTFEACTVLGERGKTDAWASATNAFCVVGGNLLEPAAPSGYWRFRLNGPETASFVEYRDEGSRFNGMTFTVDCVRP